MAEKIENPVEETDQGHLAEEIEETIDECPECGAIVREVKMGTHRFLAHNVDRRASTTDNPDNPTPPPEKEPKPKSSDQGRNKSRHWWFGDRHQHKS